jgi:hypothetical protein
MRASDGQHLDEQSEFRSRLIGARDHGAHEVIRKDYVAAFCSVRDDC